MSAFDQQQLELDNAWTDLIQANPLRVSINHLVQVKRLNPTGQSLAENVMPISE